MSKEKSIRDRIVLKAPILGVYCFILMFASTILTSILASKLSLEIKPMTGFFVFFPLTIFFFGLAHLHPKATKEYWASWGLFMSFMLTSIGSAIVFVSTIFLKMDPNKSPFGMIGILMFLAGCALFAGVPMLTGKNRRLKNKEVLESVGNALAEAAREMNLSLRDFSKGKKPIMIAEGVIDLGRIRLMIGNNLSQIEVSLQGRMIGRVNITALNEATQVSTESQKKDSIEAFIKEKQLNCFNFNLNTRDQTITVNIETLIEEKELWLDYIELIRKVVSQ